MIRHVVWDWNGTLFNDVHVVVDATNVCLAEYGAAPIDLATYRRLFRRPIRDFNGELIGQMIDDEQWTIIDELFHSHYRTSFPSCELATGAIPALDSFRDAGLSQSLLSMWRHDELVTLLAERELSSRFARVDGDLLHDGGSKAQRLVTHLEAQSIDASDVILVGDTVDDAIAATSAGAACVLVSENSCQTPEVLREAAYVVPTLKDAAAYLLGATKI